MARPTKRVEKEILTTVKFHDSPICKRINALLEKGDTKDFCRKLGITERTMYHWRKGQSRPDIDRLGDIADYFGVTTDYLTGRIDNPSPNVEVAAICEYTGLSDKAAGKLHEMTLNKAESYSESEIFSKIITDGRFGEFMKRVQLFTEEFSKYKIKSFKHDEDFSMEDSFPSTFSEYDAEVSASAVDKRLISPEDFAHFYRKLSVELIESILLSLPNKYIGEYLGLEEEDCA